MASVTDAIYYDAFISYRHATGLYAANLIYEKLIHAGYRVFIDKNIESRDEGYWEQIKAAIARSANFLLMLFPGDLDDLSERNWLRREAGAAVAYDNVHLIPILCDGFHEEPENLPHELSEVIKGQGVALGKDCSVDQQISLLCRYLKNAIPVMKNPTTQTFFQNHFKRKNASIKSVDLAFHAGRSWRSQSENKPILDEILERGSKVRILINSPSAAESMTVHMRSLDADYRRFEDMIDSWQNYAKAHSGQVEVKVCPIPLMRVYHAIEFFSEPLAEGNLFDRIFVRDYVYRNFDLRASSSKELSIYSNQYNVYKNEFGFLWEISESL